MRMPDPTHMLIITTMIIDDINNTWLTGLNNEQLVHRFREHCLFLAKHLLEGYAMPRTKEAMQKIRAEFTRRGLEVPES